MSTIATTKAQAIETTASIALTLKKARRPGFDMQRYTFGAVSICCGLVIWQLLSMMTTPLFLPSPALTWQGLIELWSDGTLTGAVLASGARIGIGWSLGVVVGIPLGIFMGHYRWVRQFFEPYIEFFRFIPPIAFVTLAVIWMGPGETSKIALIFYTTVFIVTLNTLAGALAVPELRLRARLPWAPIVSPH